MNVHIPCPCPGRPHPGDRITLRDELDFRRAVAMRDSILVFKRDNKDSDESEMLAVLRESYLIQGVESWSLVDEKGEAVPVSRSTIRDRLLSQPEIAIVVADEADVLYKGKVVGPLATWVRRFSPTSPIGGSTSPTNGSAPVPPTPSSPSSTSTTPTDAIETSSLPLAGVSSSSPN